MGRKDQSPMSFFCHDRINFDDDDQMMQYIQDSIMLTGQLNNIIKSIKKKIKTFEIQRPKTDGNAESSERNDTKLEEDKLKILLKGINEIAQLHPSSNKFFTMIKDGVDD